mgnify:FL=1|tara:strand:- start:93 stop:521 length:429 start_codon:yes stop_codon:yes gene_type:complete
MGEEFYSIIKLISGEEIFALVSVDDTNLEPVVILQNPLVMKMIPNKMGIGGMVKVRKWMELSDDDMFIISYDKILTMSECKDDKIISIYNNYILDEMKDNSEVYKQQGKVKLTNKMGYISSVEDARKKFEVLFKINQEPKES